MTPLDKAFLYAAILSLSFLLFSWGVYALAAAKAILSSVFEAGENENGEDGEGGAEPVGPDGSGDEADPADWWKKEGTGTK